MCCSATSSRGPERGLVLALAFAGVLLGCAPRGQGLVLPPEGSPETVSRQVGVMGTDLTVTVTAAGRAQALAASERAIRRVEEAERALSTWRDDSALAAVNRAPVGTPVSVSPWIADALANALACAQATRGAFDPTLGALVTAWGLRTGGRAPTEGELSDARGRVGWPGLVVTGAQVRRRAPVTVEEGGFGKGAGLDRALEALAEAGALRAELSLGGQIAVLGEPGWVPLAHPRRRARPWLEVRLPAGSLATTGNGERGIVVNGERRAHVLDPRTGAPTGDWGSLSVWSSSAAWADCLSTGLYVLGPRAALTEADRQAGVEAVAIELTPRGPRVRGTPGLTLRCAPDAPPDCAEALTRGAADPVHPERGTER